MALILITKITLFSPVFCWYTVYYTNQHELWLLPLISLVTRFTFYFWSCFQMIKTLKPLTRWLYVYCLTKCYKVLWIILVIVKHDKNRRICDVVDDWVIADVARFLWRSFHCWVTDSELSNCNSCHIHISSSWNLIRFCITNRVHSVGSKVNTVAVAGTWLKKFTKLTG